MGIYSITTQYFLAFNISNIEIAALIGFIFSLAKVSYRMLRKDMPVLFKPTFLFMWTSLVILDNVCAGLTLVIQSAFWTLSVVMFWTSFVMLACYLAFFGAVRAIGIYYQGILNFQIEVPSPRISSDQGIEKKLERKFSHRRGQSSGKFEVARAVLDVTVDHVMSRLKLMSWVGAITVLVIAGLQMWIGILNINKTLSSPDPNQFDSSLVIFYFVHIIITYFYLWYAWIRVSMPKRYASRPVVFVTAVAAPTPSPNTRQTDSSKHVRQASAGSQAISAGSANSDQELTQSRTTSAEKLSLVKADEVKRDEMR